MNKPKIAILFGGCSEEYDISLQSAASVIRNIDGNKYDIINIGISRHGVWHRYYGRLILLKAAHGRAIINALSRSYRQAGTFTA